jgi:hypothetical protein
MNPQVTEKSIKPLSSNSPVTIGLMIVILGGLGWITREIGGLRSELEHDMRQHYVTRELFEAKMSGIERQLEDLRHEVRRAK